MPIPDFDLYLVTDRNQTQRRALLWVLERALEGGVRAVQLREKDLSGRDLFQLASKTRELCDRYQAKLFVNDRIDIALAVDAAGVQLGKGSIPIETARRLLGRRKLIGYSAHSLEEVAARHNLGATGTIASQLSAGDLADLLAFVKSIDDATGKVPN